MNTILSFSSAVRSYPHVIEIDSDSDEENFVLPKPKNKTKKASKEDFKTPKPLPPKQKGTANSRGVTSVFSCEKLFVHF